MPRPTIPTGEIAVSGWRLKNYEITLDGAPTDDDVIAAAKTPLAAALPAAGPGVGVGFVIVHYGREQVWILADLWSSDIISEHTSFADLDEPTRFRPVPPGGPTACVWELAVHAHERDAYIEHVLDPANGPDVEAYLADTIAIRAVSRST